MKKRKNTFIYILIMFLFVFWLKVSTPIIAHFFNGSKVQKIDFNDFVDCLYKDPVYATVYRKTYSPESYDYIRYEGGLLQKVVVNGWALTETIQDNSGRKVALILRGKEDSYALLPEIIVRVDVRSGLADDLGVSKVNTPNNRVGYFDEFSTLCIEDGIYDLYVYCRENDTNYGMTDTEYEIEKMGDNLQVYKWQSQRIDKVPEITQMENTIGNLDNITVDEDNGLIDLRGWEVIEKGEDADKATYIEFTNDAGYTIQYETRNRVRTDVAKFYNDNTYYDSGWWAIIPEADLADGMYNVRLLTKKGDIVLQSKFYTIWKDGSDIQSIWLSQEITNVVMATHEEEATGSFDGITTGDNGLISLWGWAFAEDEDTSSQTVYIEFVDQENHTEQYTTKKMVREDVAEYYGNLLYEQSGWNAVIPIVELIDGSYTVRIVVENGEDVWKSEPLAIEKLSDGLIVH